MPLRMKQRTGFTLIELLVVISIISLISTLGIVRLSKHKQEARDSKRYADATTLMTAAQIFYHERSEYPDVAAATPCSIDGPCLSSGTVFWLQPEMKQYLSPFPIHDPGHHPDPDLDKYLYVNDFGPGSDIGIAIYFCLERGQQYQQCDVLTPSGFTLDCSPDGWSNMCAMK